MGAAGIGAGVAAVVDGTGLVTVGIAVDFFFRGVLVEYLLQGKKSLIRIFSSVDSDSESASSFFRKESFSGLMCRWVCLKETLPSPAGSFPFGWGMIWSCMALRPTLLSSCVSRRSSHMDDSSLIWISCSWILELCSRMICRRWETSSWRSRRVLKRWGRGWSTNKVGLGVGSTSWVELVAIVVDSPWDSIESSDWCCFVGRRSTFPQVDRSLAKSYNIRPLWCDPWFGALALELALECCLVPQE
jgi:hypothetical protein